MILVTNNPLVQDRLKTKDIRFLEGSYLEVLEETRNYIHLNHKLLTHPLSGSIKPNETPYKSIALTESNKLDVDSLILIENAIAVYIKLQNDKKTPNWNQKILDDFMVIDLDLIENAVINSV